MTGPEVSLAVAVFLACLVEAVEALTIVVAVGVERSWRSALWGTAAALGLLGVVVAVLGPSVGAIPLGPLRIVVGGLLLIFGLGWLRKAILRGAGRKTLHDEAAIYARQAALARAAAGGGIWGGLDGYAFTIALKAVLLEGIEVAFIVVTFGANQHHVGLAAIAAVLAVAVVAIAGAAARAPLARVPENTLKLGVGIMLTAFGTFWATEGAGGSWPGGDAALLVIVPGFAAVALVSMWMLRAGRS